MTTDIEARTIRRVSWRLIPFLIVCYFVAYLDRVNVGFASLTMNRDLGISATAYGLGAGLFFITYFIFEVPSNLALEKFGARRWIALPGLSLQPSEFLKLTLVLWIADHYARRQKHLDNPRLVLLPWQQYLAWARVEAFFGLTRTSGPTAITVPAASCPGVTGS